MSCVSIFSNFDVLCKNKILEKFYLVFSQLWRMSSQYDEEHFTLVSFALYCMESCLEAHLKSTLLLNLCKCILCFFAKIKMLIFFTSLYFIVSLFSQLSNEV